MKTQEFILTWHGTIPQKAMEDVIRLVENERAKTINEAEKLLDKIAPDKVVEIKCYDGEIRNRPLIDFAKVYEILEQMKEQKGEQK